MFAFPDPASALGEQPRGFQPEPIKAVDATLLPPNATALEQAVAKSVIATFSVDVEIDKLWDPWECPVDFLPYLAWALNVDLWDTSWPEDVKRKVIAGTTLNHWKKGTKAAVKDALDAVGITAVVKEWHELDPQGTPGTFQIQLILRDDVDTGNPELIDQGRIDAAKRLVNRVKRQSQHYTVSTGVQSTFEAGLGLAQQATTTVLQTTNLEYKQRTTFGLAFGSRAQVIQTILQEAII